MATSWKKIKNNKYEILYINKKEDTLVQIVNNSRLLGWYVSVFKSKSGLFNYNNMILSDRFKTKSAALKFAKNWMKKHPYG